MRTWSSRLACGAISTLVACTPARQPSAPTPVVALEIPSTVDDYRLTATEPIQAPFPGTLYRFTDGSPTRVTVFVFPITDDVKEGSDSVRWLAGEAEKFQQILPLQVERGRYDEFKIAFAKPETVETKDGLLPGHSTGAVTKKDGAISIEFQYLFLVRGQFLKVRATVPEEGWEETTVPNFARALARATASR